MNGKDHHTEVEQLSLFEDEQLEREPAKTEKVSKPPREGKRYRAGTLHLVPCSRIMVPEGRVRSCKDDEELSFLADSIHQKGVLCPVLCTVDESEHLTLAAGERRLEAAKTAGLEKIPVIIVDGDPLEVSLAENMARKSLTVVQESEGLAQLRKNKGYQLKTLAALVGKAESTVSEILGVAELPAAILNDCRDTSSISRDILVRISRLETEDEKLEAYKEWQEGSLTREKIQIRLNKSEVENPRHLKAGQMLSKFEKLVREIDTEKLTRDERAELRERLEKIVSYLSSLMVVL